MSVRIQRRRTKGYRLPPDAIYVGRPTLWGNPYSLDDVRVMYPDIAPADRAGVAVRLYRRELKHFGLLSDYGYTAPGGTIEAADERWEAVYRLVVASGAKNMAEYAAIALRGHDLVCWCPISAPCHADVLLELAG